MAETVSVDVMTIIVIQTVHTQKDVKVTKQKNSNAPQKTLQYK